MTLIELWTALRIGLPQHLGQYLGIHGQLPFATLAFPFSSMHPFVHLCFQ